MMKYTYSIFFGLLLLDCYGQAMHQVSTHSFKLMHKPFKRFVTRDISIVDDIVMYYMQHEEAFRVAAAVLTREETFRSTMVCFEYRRYIRHQLEDQIKKKLGKK